jgi:hypothetical protein
MNELTAQEILDKQPTLEDQFPDLFRLEEMSEEERITAVFKWMYTSQRKPIPALGLIHQCERCKNFYNIPWPIKICSSCIDTLRDNFPEIFLVLQQENMRLYDAQAKG